MGNVGYDGLAAVQGDIEPGLIALGRRVAERSPAPVPLDLNLYCINLQRSPRRRQYMAQQAERHGLVLHFIDAIDGISLDLAATGEYRFAERRARFGWDLEANEVAAALSHRKALEAIRAAGHERAIVMEDDVTLLPDFMAVVAALYRRRDLAFDIIRLFGFRNRPGNLVAVLDQVHSIERPYRPMCGLQAYMVNAASIDRIIEAFIPITMQADVAIDRFWENDLRILRVRPFLVAESNLFASDIGVTGDRWRVEKKRLIRLGLRARRALDHVTRAAYILRKF
jgi:GR25 family glycosyltransferase involved in LPS biosynthesis